jgi:septum formation protein
MLHRLSGEQHEVITAVSFTTARKRKTVHCTTEVRFRELTIREIQYYVSHYNTMDKAGGYGIQEWIGLVGIEGITGSYFNVMGLPTHLVYQTLSEWVSDPF